MAVSRLWGCGGVCPLSRAVSRLWGYGGICPGPYQGFGGVGVLVQVVYQNFGGPTANSSGGSILLADLILTFAVALVLEDAV